MLGPTIPFNDDGSMSANLSMATWKVGRPTSLSRAPWNSPAGELEANDGLSQNVGLTFFTSVFG